MLVKISQNSEGNTCTGVPFLIKLKRLWHRCFLAKFGKFLRTPFNRTPPVAASPNPCYLHCVILKTLHAFQEKRDLNSRDMHCFLQNFPNEIFMIFKMFENDMKLIRAACWINMVINNISHYYGEIENYCWKWDREASSRRFVF